MSYSEHTKPAERVEVYTPQDDRLGRIFIETTGWSHRHAGNDLPLVVELTRDQARQLAGELDHSLGILTREQPDETPQYPTTTCGCGFELVWVDGEWQHDAAPYFWGDDHAPDAPPPALGHDGHLADETGELDTAPAIDPALIQVGTAFSTAKYIDLVAQGRPFAGYVTARGATGVRMTVALEEVTSVRSADGNTMWRSDDTEGSKS